MSKKITFSPIFICAVLVIAFAFAAGCISSGNNDELLKQMSYHPDDSGDILSVEHDGIIGNWTFDIEYTDYNYYLEITDNNSFISKLITNIDTTAGDSGNIKLDNGDMIEYRGYLSELSDNRYQLLSTQQSIYDKDLVRLFGADINPELFADIEYNNISDKLTLYYDNSSTLFKRVM